MLRLTEEWTIDFDAHDFPNGSITNLKGVDNILKDKTHPYKGTIKVSFASGKVTFPVGTLFKFMGVKKPSRRSERRNYGDKSFVHLKLIETTLPYKIDSLVPILTPKRKKPAKKQRNKPLTILKLPMDLAASFEFEYSV